MSKGLQHLVERYDRLTAQMEQTAIGRLNAALEASYLNIESKVKAQYLKVDGDRLMVSRQSLARLEQIKALLEVVNTQVAATLEPGLQETFGLSHQLGTSMASELSTSIAPSLAFKTVDIPIEAAAFAAKDSIARLSRYSQVFRENATAIVTQGLIQGWAVVKVQSQMRHQLGIAKGKAEMLASTEVLSALNSAAKANYKANGIRHSQVISTSDRKTCSLCRTRNLNVYRIDEISLPFHPKCRCFTLPYSPQWRLQGLIDESWEQQYYAGDDGWIGDNEMEAKPSPFEKATGIAVAPSPIWTARQGVVDDG